MSRRPPCHLDADQLRAALGLDELVIVYRLGDRLGYVAAGRDARRTVDARRAGDVALVAVCDDRGVTVDGLVEDGHVPQGETAEGGDAAVQAAAAGGGESDA